MNKHTLWMIIGCGLPLVLIFFAPVLGISSNVSIFVFILAMFGCHLLMPMHHGGHHSNNIENPKKENHEHHQH